jgi:hypothetical protein
MKWWNENSFTSPFTARGDSKSKDQLLSSPSLAFPILFDRGGKIWPDTKNPSNPSGPDLIFLESQTNPNPTRPGPRRPETRDNLRSECPKADLTQTQTTQNPRWSEIRWLETWPDPNSRQPATWDDLRSKDLKPDLTQTRMTRDDPKLDDPEPDPTWSNFEIFKYDWTIIRI